MVPPQERCPEFGKRNLVVMTGKMGGMDDALGVQSSLSWFKRWFPSSDPSTRSH